MPDTSYSRSVTQTAITQGAAGSLDIAAAGVGARIYVTRLVLVASGAATVKLQENASTDLTGAMPLVAGVPLQLFGANGEAIAFTNTAGLKLNLVSVTLPVFGWVHWYYAP